MTDIAIILKTVWGLLVLGFVLGHGIAAEVEAYKFWRHRKQSPTYRYFALLFASIGMTPALLAVAIAELPKPIPKGAAWTFFATLIVLAIGTWPTVIYLEGKRKNGGIEKSGDRPPEFWMTTFREIVRSELEEYEKRKQQGRS